ncbi:interactor of constitutive active ROPs 3-like isoform X1 [Typha angustifolia]|uniref:interactor of constitutive active ROPs 3-like isoform X1 n=2 Tax=Typha angustifolia TaxID=59011 RepID=UPI003C30155C
MQKPNSRSGSVEVTQRTSSVVPRSNGPSNVIESESNSLSCKASTRSPKHRSTKVIERRSPVSSEREKKRPSKVTELENQLLQLQDDLKKAKDQMISSELSKKRAKQETEEARKQLLVMSATLKDSESQLAEFSAVEEARLLELRKISQERDRAWESELEAMQKQHSIDSAALASSMNEVHRLKLQLDMSVRSQASQAKQLEAEHLELEELKQDMAEAVSTIEDLKLRLNRSEKAEAEVKAMFNEAKQQLEISRATIDTLLTDGSKLMDSFSLVVSELEESRVRVHLLEETVKDLQKDQSADRCQVATDSPPKDYCNSLELEELRSALEEAVVKYQEEQIVSIMQTQRTYEVMDQMKTDSTLREEKLKTELESFKSEVITLKANLFDKDAELRSISEEAQMNEMESKLKDKEMALQSILDENAGLKLEMENLEMEKVKACEAAIAEAKVARSAEQEALMGLKLATAEANESNKRATAATEKLEAAEAVKTEMERELKRLRVQAEQWRKAADVAMAMLTVGSNGRLVERTDSLGKLMSLPFPDELDDESLSKKNSNVLRRISGMWKK